LNLLENTEIKRQPIGNQGSGKKKKKKKIQVVKINEDGVVSYCVGTQ